MAKLLVLFLALAVIVIVESKSISNVDEACLDCVEGTYKRTKRADAPAILNSISGLVNGILDTNWSYITRLNAQKLAAQRKPDVYIGSGDNNYNAVTFNGNSGGDYNDYNEYNNRNQRNQRNRGNRGNRRNYDYYN